MKTSEVLNRAADLIEERGWTRGMGWESIFNAEAARSVCLEGALQVASGMGAVEVSGLVDVSVRVNLCPAGIALKDYLGQNPNRSLFEWNDRPGRTAAEVIEVLRATALIEAAKEQPEPVHEDADERAEVGAK